MSPPLSRLRPWFRALSALNRRRLVVAGILGVLLVGACVVLNNTPHPGEGKAARYLADHEAGKRKRLPTEYFSQVYLWKAGALNAGLLAALLVTSPLWVAWLSGDGKQRDDTGGVAAVKPSRNGWLLFGFALLVGLSLRLPQMERPLLFDEQDNLRRSFHGYVDVTEKGEQWMGASWRDTFFENRQANNPVLFGVLARCSMDTWRTLTGGAEDTFNLWMMRLPSLLAGLLTMLVLWRLLHAMGSPLAATLAVFLFALHPLAIEYNVQARGYGLVMLFTTLAAASAYRGLREPGWKPWILYGLSEVAMLWSYPGSLYLALAMNGFLGVYFLVRWLRRGERVPLVRFGLVSVVSGMLYLQVMLPVVVQAREFLEEKFAHAELRADWAFTVVSGYLSGHALPEVAWWHEAEADERDLGAYVTERFLPEHPLRAVLAFAVFPILLGAGLESLRRKDRRALLIVGAGLVSLLVAFLHQRLFTGLWLHYWYVIYILPFLCLAAALGFAALVGKRPAHACWACLAFLLFFALAVAPPRPAVPGSVYRASPEVTEIGRPGYVYRITKEGRMTREIARP